jgi:hypothetical protein
MKNFLILLFVFLAAQLNAQQKFGVGIKVGQNFSKVNNVAVDHNAASYHLGATMQIGLSKGFSIAPDVLLSQTKLEANPTPNELLANKALKPETYHLNYLTIPVLLQYDVVKSFLIQAGPQYGILLDQSKDGAENARVAFSAGEFAMVGGAKLNLGGFFLYGRYVIGMNNIGSATQLSNNIKDESTWKTRQWQLGVGLRLL